MAVYAPDDTPNAAAPNADPGMFARIQQYLAGLSPIGSANAAPAPPPDPDALARQQALAVAGQHLGPNGIIGQPPSNPADVLPISPSIVGGGGSSGGGGASNLAPPSPSGSGYGDPRLWGASYPHMPWPDTGVAPPPRPGGIGSDANIPIKTPGGTYAAPGRQPAPAAAPAAAGGDPNRFGTFQYQVPNQGIAPGAGSMGGQGSRAPIYTALNLGGMFGGGGANPANVPAANAQPVSGGVLSKAGTAGLSKAPWNYGPQQSKVGWGKKKYGPDATDAAAYHSGFA
jgi:hypothetical protein